MTKQFDPTGFIPGISLDCVIFGFDGGKIKVLLVRMRGLSVWSLPGGFIKEDEHADDAAKRVLKERTGVDKLFLQQFHLFTDPNRTSAEYDDSFIEHGIVSQKNIAFFNRRFMSLGYYALANHKKVNPTIDYLSDACEWHHLDSLPALIYDHKKILDEALLKIQRDLQYHPVGQNLLPAKFTMPELQALYEAILGKSLDRRNFARRMMSYHILDKLEEHRTGMAHKSPRLYRFNKKAYDAALRDGLSNKW
jgi:ADP-ribose pyrophosphatase YjhB (NUDIX family)